MTTIPKLSVLALAMALAACGGNSEAPPRQIVGVFHDSAVEGLEYVDGAAAKASTNAAGEFTCTPGNQVSFSIGGLALGSTYCNTVITPKMLAGVADIKDTKVVNRLMALQILDADVDPSNGIKIGADVKTALAGKSLDFNAAATTFNSAMSASLLALDAKYSSRTVDESRRIMAVEHFQDTLAGTLGTPMTESSTQKNAVGDVTVAVTRFQIRFAASDFVPYEGSNAKVKEDFPNGFLPSFGSGLTFKGTAANGNLEFYGLTDRGPNGDGPNVPNGTGVLGSKIFPSPSFAPSVGIITVGSGGAVLSSIIPLKVSATVKATGLPLPPGSIGNSAEAPVMDAMVVDLNSKATYNAGGIDTEGIALDKKRNVLWLSDEYGPFLTKVDVATGIILEKFGPGNGLPAIFAKRRANRGMEGMAYDAATDKVHAYLQSPLSDGSAAYSVTRKNEAVERYARFTRWAEFDPTTATTSKMYAYPLSGAEYADGRTGNAKLGEMVSIGNGKFIVIEQGSGVDGKVFNKLMLVDITGATDISAAAFNATTSDLEKSSMSGTAVNGADWSKVVPVKKSMLLDLNAIGWLAEKAEGLAVVDGSTLALANDNDFGLATKIYTPAGVAVAGADVTKCNVNAAGVIITSSTRGCDAANSIRVTRGTDSERASRLWVLKFSKALNTY